MSSSFFLFSTIVVALVSVSIATDKKSSATADGAKPNIVVILADDLGIGDIGCYGNTSLPTPNIDRLANEGAKMTQFLTAAALCTPSRAAFLTGRYPIRSGMGGNKDAMVTLYTASPAGLPPSEITFAEVLKSAGYSTAIIGKWHQGLHGSLVGDNYHNPLKQGFDYWFGIPLTNMKDFDDEEANVLELAYPNYVFYTNLSTLAGSLGLLYLYKTGSLGLKLSLLILLSIILLPQIPIFLGSNMKFWNSMLYRNYDLVEQPIKLETLTNRLVSESVEYLEDKQMEEKPFLLFLSLVQVHTVLHAGPKFHGASKYGRYGDEVMEMDWCVGQVLEALDRLGLTDNTLVMFTSDHGGHVEEKGKHGDRQGGHNGIYRGGKIQGGMDGGIRVPAVIRWPGHIKPGTQIDDPVSNMDFLPTAAAAAGVQPPGDRVLDGVNLLPVLTGQKSEVEGRDYFIHYCSHYVHALRFKPDKNGAVWKVRYVTPKWLPGTEGCGFACFCGQSWHTFHEVPLVFDMTSDPRESHPLATDDIRAKHLVKEAADAIKHHQNSLQEVALQLVRHKLWVRPWLIDCCNFPYCKCEDKKHHKYEF